MRTLNLVEAKYHTELYVVQTGNSFGDQLLEFRHEALDGTKCYAFASFDEGCWYTWDKNKLIDLWNSLPKFFYNGKSAPYIKMIVELGK